MSVAIGTHRPFTLSRVGCRRRNRLIDDTPLHGASNVKRFLLAVHGIGFVPAIQPFVGETKGSFVGADQPFGMAAGVERIEAGTEPGAATRAG